MNVIEAFNKALLTGARVYVGKGLSYCMMQIPDRFIGKVDMKYSFFNFKLTAEAILSRDWKAGPREREEDIKEINGWDYLGGDAA